MKKKIVFIINPISGTIKKDEIPLMISEEIDANLFDITVLFTEYRGHGCELARIYLSKGYDYIVAVGGDGTVNEVARELIHSTASLGIVPIGSGNGLARHLNIPMSPRKAIAQINHSESILIDYGIVKDRKAHV